MPQEQEDKETEALTVQPEDVQVETMSADASALQKQEDSTRKMLKEVDESRLDGCPSLIDMWDRIAGFHDTNELVRVNIQQVQHMLQEAYEEHQRQKIEDNARLKTLFNESKEDPKKADEYTALLWRIQNDRKLERKEISQMATTVTNLAKEYRSCSMQRAMFIHIALIQQFTILISASIQRNVRDPHALRAIGDDIKQAKYICFPAQSGE